MLPVLRATTVAPSWMAGLPLVALAAVLLGSPGSWSNAVWSMSGSPTRSAEVVLPSGTPMTIELTDGLSSLDSHVGDLFAGRVALPVMVQERVAIAPGARISGHVAGVRSGTRFEPRARLHLAYDSIVIDGHSYPLRVRRTLDEPLGPRRDATLGGGSGVVGGVFGRASSGAPGGRITSSLGIFGLPHSSEAPSISLGPGTRLAFTLDRDLMIRQP